MVISWNVTVLSVTSGLILYWQLPWKSDQSVSIIRLQQIILLFADILGFCGHLKGTTQFIYFWVGFMCSRLVSPIPRTMFISNIHIWHLSPYCINDSVPASFARGGAPWRPEVHSSIANVYPSLIFTLVLPTVLAAKTSGSAQEFRALIYIFGNINMSQSVQSISIPRLKPIMTNKFLITGAPYAPAINIWCDYPKRILVGAHGILIETYYITWHPPIPSLSSQVACQLHGLIDDAVLCTLTLVVIIRRWGEHTSTLMNRLCDWSFFTLTLLRNNTS